MMHGHTYVKLSPFQQEFRETLETSHFHGHSEAEAKRLGKTRNSAECCTDEM
jgi:hypothetical protein